jgi:hypothetical protein
MRQSRRQKTYTWAASIRRQNRQCFFLPIQKASAAAQQRNVSGAGSGVLTDGTTAIPASGSMLVPNWLSKTPEVEKS